MAGKWKEHKNNSIYVTWKDYTENLSVGKTNDDYHFTQEEMRVNLMWGSQVRRGLRKKYALRRIRW